MNRRSILKALPFFGAAAAAPTMLKAAEPESLSPAERMAVLIDQLQDVAREVDPTIYTFEVAQDPDTGGFGRIVACRDLVIDYDGPSQYDVKEGKVVSRQFIEEVRMKDGKLMGLLSWDIADGERTGIARYVLPQDLKLLRKIKSDMQPWGHRLRTI